MMLISGIHDILSLTNSHQPMPEVKPPKKEKIKPIYEDNDFIIDLLIEEKTVRVSVFEGGHFKDEVFVKWED